MTKKLPRVDDRLVALTRQSCTRHGAARLLRSGRDESAREAALAEDTKALLDSVMRLREKIDASAFYFRNRTELRRHVMRAASEIVRAHDFALKVAREANARIAMVAGVVSSRSRGRQSMIADLVVTDLVAAKPDISGAEVLALDGLLRDSWRSEHGFLAVPEMRRLPEATRLVRSKKKQL